MSRPRRDPAAGPSRAGDSGAPADSPIEVYLDQLFMLAQRLPPRAARRLVAEAEGHLLEAAGEGRRAGLAPFAAERRAVERFGPSADIVDAERRTARLSLRVMAGAILTSALFLGSVGAIAVGLSGVVAAGLRLALGTEFLADAGSGAALSPSNCARWLAASPGATTCRQAALADWASEIVGYRIVAGVLGLATLGAFVLLRRWCLHGGRWHTLPPSIVDTIAVTAFAGSCVWLAGMGIDAMVVASGDGAGQWLSAAPVAAAAATVFGLRLLRQMRDPRPEPSVRSAHL